MMLDLGATALEPPSDVGEGILVAAVRDPFGNRLGLIENPHFSAEKVR
jgi:predicted enzyme related to lactoylglutathione lyase